MSFQLIKMIKAVLKKYLMDNKFSNPYELCFFEGFSGLIFNGIFILVKYFSDKKYLDILIDYKSKINIKEILILISLVILYLILHLFFLITIKIYNPYYVLIIYSFNAAFSSLYGIDSKTLKFKVIIIILFCILFFVFLIFIEIIELNFCGLSYNTKKNIEIRARKESCILDEEIEDNKSNNSDDEIEIGRFSFKINEINNLEKETKFIN